MAHGKIPNDVRIAPIIVFAVKNSPAPIKNRKAHNSRKPKHKMPNLAKATPGPCPCIADAQNDPNDKTKQMPAAIKKLITIIHAPPLIEQLPSIYPTAENFQKTFCLAKLHLSTAFLIRFIFIFNYQISILTMSYHLIICFIAVPYKSLFR